MVLKVLMVDDDEGDYVLVRDCLSEAQMERFELDWASTYRDALETMVANRHDVCLLDYQLGAENGLDLLDEARSLGCVLPIIFVTQHGSPQEVVVAALRIGADDYLPKGLVDPSILERSIRYAVERHRLVLQLENTRQREDEARELKGLDRISTPATTAATAHAFGLHSLREAMPERFDALVKQYALLLDAALDLQIFRDEDTLTRQIIALTDELGLLRAGPRDVVELHSRAFHIERPDMTAERRRARVEEGRLILLELMGRLVSYYRSYVLPRNRAASHKVAD